MPMSQNPKVEELAHILGRQDHDGYHRSVDRAMGMMTNPKPHPAKPFDWSSLDEELQDDLRDEAQEIVREAEGMPKDSRVEQVAHLLARQDVESLNILVQRKVKVHPNDIPRVEPNWDRLADWAKDQYREDAVEVLQCLGLM